MMAEMIQAITAANDDPAVGAVVVTGAGRAFCAGADIGSQFKAQIDAGAGDEDAAAKKAAERRDAEGKGSGARWVSFCRSSKPLIGAINGHAIGIGLTMVLPFDHLVAAEGAKLSCRFVKMGITPELASSHYLVQRCGWGGASDLALTGRIVEAPEARSLGLVDNVVPADELLATAVAKAVQFGENPAPQLRMIKELLSVNGSETDTDLVQRRELDKLAQALKTPEHHEAVAAFMEKRAPKFR